MLQVGTMASILMAQELGVSREGSDSLHPEAWLLSKK